MRVIAGRFKGMGLATARTGTRPTTDRTKEAVFSRLDAWGILEDARVLDLYAGTGALGIEALSRGSRELVAVESAPAMATAIGETLTALRRHPSWQSGMRAHVVRASVERYVERNAGNPFDVVFIDPPYAVRTQECEALLAGLADSGMVDHDGLIVLERSTRSSAPAVPDGWHVAQCREYGETAVHYVERS